MPELPEVQTIVNQLQRKIVGKKIKSVKINLAKLINGVKVKDFEKIVNGAKIEKVSRRAKLIIIELSNHYSLIVHLKLTGRLIFKKKLEED
jgi:formamidopyrimidine-DNA glycosylase